MAFSRGPAGTRARRRTVRTTFADTARTPLRCKKQGSPSLSGAFSGYVVRWCVLNVFRDCIISSIASSASASRGGLLFTCAGQQSERVHGAPTTDTRSRMRSLWTRGVGHRGGGGRTERIHDKRTFGVHLGHHHLQFDLITLTAAGNLFAKGSKVSCPFMRDNC